MYEALRRCLCVDIAVLMRLADHIQVVLRDRWHCAAGERREMREKIKAIEEKGVHKQALAVSFARCMCVCE